MLRDQTKNVIETNIYLNDSSSFMNFLTKATVSYRRTTDNNCGNEGPPMIENMYSIGTNYTFFTILLFSGFLGT